MQLNFIVLDSDGKFDIEDEDLSIIETDKQRFIDWFTAKLNLVNIHSTTFDQCIHCVVGNPVVLFNDGRFPRATIENADRSKTGLMLAIKGQKITRLKFCFVYLRTENKYNFECNAEKIKQYMAEGLSFEDAFMKMKTFKANKLE